MLRGRNTLKINIPPQPQPITTPGIYWNQIDGLISLSSDGSTWLTITDKNLGATTVYNEGDVLSEANCGKYYQWGNNYGFPWAGDVTTSSTRVDASSYGPGNYYSSSTFIITSDDDWSSVDNSNLWGGDIGTNEAMQGPCPSGFHVPNDRELRSLDDLLSDIGVIEMSDIKACLKLPFSGYRNGMTGAAFHIYDGNLWGSNGELGVYADCLSYTTDDIFIDFYPRADGYSIRPFKNTPVQPYSTRTVLYQPS